MRASTLFGITIAGLLGLGVVVGAKYAGLFDPKTPIAQEEAPRQILVARQNLFEGTTTSASDVFVRPLRKEEIPWWNENKTKLLPALPAAAHMRTLARSVGADQPLKIDDFHQIELPENISARLKALGKDYRAVNVVIPKEKAAGGLIQRDELVDVYLTTVICGDSSCVVPTTMTAPIARNVKVIAKRNNLWTVMQPVDPTAPVHYTLAANAYRAALIDYAKFKGQITLVPTPVFGRPGGKSGAEPESADESERVGKFLAGELIVGDPDLERIFNLKPRPPRDPNRTIQRWTGINPVSTYSFTGNGTLAGPEGSATVAMVGAQPMGYQFRDPGNFAAAAPRTGGG
jgi:Flp pilus assembly protein CpaB